MSGPVGRELGMASEGPNDVQHPKLYENAAWLLGGVSLMCIVAIALLAAFAPQSESFGAVVTGLVSIGTLAVNGLVQLFRREKA